MMMLIHRICMALSGLGKFISVTKEMSVKAAMLLQTSRGRLRLPSPLSHRRLAYSRAQLEAHKVLDVAVDAFPLLDGGPADTPGFVSAPRLSAAAATRRL